MSERAELNKCRPILIQGLRRDIEINFHFINIYGSKTHWISAVDLKDSGSIPSQGDFLSLKFLFKEEMNQMVKNNNNSRYSLVFGRWPRTKTSTNIYKYFPTEPILRSGKQKNYN